MGAENNFWILKPFNPLFIGVFLAFVALLALASLALRKKPEKTRQTALVAACVVTFVGFFVYKYALSLDSEYNTITAQMGGFNWWGELPLQLCNISMILIPIAVLAKNRPLMCFGFFIGPLGALMALAMPGNGFDGYSLLLPRMLGFYGTHFMIVIEGWALVAFGLFRPRFSDIPKAVLTLVLLALAVFGINMLLRWSGLHSKANYFFSVETEGNPLLELFHSWIPVPFLYLIPCIGVLAIYMALVMSGFGIVNWIRGKRAGRA